MKGEISWCERILELNSGWLQRLRTWALTGTVAAVGFGLRDGTILAPVLAMVFVLVLAFNESRLHVQDERVFQSKGVMRVALTRYESVTEPVAHAAFSVVKDIERARMGYGLEHSLLVYYATLMTVAGAATLHICMQS